MLAPEPVHARKQSTGLFSFLTRGPNIENSRLDVEIGAKIGNAYVDVGYAAKALADAAKKLKDAKSKLSKMQRLKGEGRASQKAVDLAYTQVALAIVGVATATAGLAVSIESAAAAASSSQLEQL